MGNPHQFGTSLWLRWETDREQEKAIKAYADYLESLTPRPMKDVTPIIQYKQLTNQ